MPRSRVAFRFGIVLLPALFGESALGVFSAGVGASPGSGLFDLHVGLGLALILLAAGAFVLVWRREGTAARASSGVVLGATLAVAVVASASLSVGFAGAGLLERLLALAALLGALGMILAGYSAPPDLPERAPAVETPG